MTVRNPIGPSAAAATASTAVSAVASAAKIAAVIAAALMFGVAGASLPAARAADTSFASIVSEVQPKVVKIYGAGGVQGLEAYQSGFLISSEGHILTSWSYVLDTDGDGVVVILDDGRRFMAKTVGADPKLEIAVLKIDAKDLPFFKLDDAIAIETGSRVLAFCNLFNVATGNESVSVLHGVVTAKTPLSARRGAFETTYGGTVYVLDAMTNNPGATGGVLTDRRGRIVGILGKELKNSLNNTWLNYAVPIAELDAAVDDILAGKVRPRSASAQANVKKPKNSLTLKLLGVTLVPDVLAKTPPYVDRVTPGSAAAKAGLKADDLVLYVNERAIASCKVLIDEMTFIDRDDEVRWLVQRGQQLIELTLSVD